MSPIAMPHIDYDTIAEIYDLYVTARYDIPFFLSETATVAGRVLELTAGTGRLSIPLVEAGVQLTCVDRSQGMLRVLAKKLKQRGVHAGVICADICQLPFRERFELAILPFQSFMEIVGEENQRAALAAVFFCLAPGGRFICTLHNPVVRRRQVDGLLRVVGKFATPDGTIVVSGFERDGQPTVRRVQLFELFAPDGSLRRTQVLPMEFDLIEEQAFRAMAQGAAFRISGLYGSYDRVPFDRERSPVMIWILEKSGNSAVEGR